MLDIFELIQERQSTRAPFDPGRLIAGRDLGKILEAGRWAPTAHNMQNFEVVVVDDQELVAAIGDIERPMSEVFVAENYQQLSFTEEELLRKKTGILATRFPPALRKPKIDVTDAQALASLRRPLPATPLLLIVLYDPGRRAPASEGDFLGIISLGCVLENMWLAAHALGIGLHVVSSIGAVENEVKSLLQIPDHLRIAFSCRLGYPASAPDRYLRVRREVEDFTHYNRFGEKDRG